LFILTAGFLAELIREFALQLCSSEEKQVSFF